VFIVFANKLAGICTNLFGIVNVDFDMMAWVLDRYSAFVKYLKKWECIPAVSEVFTDLRKACVSVRSEVWLNMPIKFSVPKCLNETCRKSG